MSRQRPVRKEKVCKDHMEHNSESVAVLSNVHLTWRNIFHVGAPICIQSTLPTCFLFLQVPRPLRPLSSHLLAHLALNAFSQSKHHQPPADSHQHLLFWVTFSPFIKKTTLSQLPLNASTTQRCFGQPLPKTPYQILCSTNVILSILDCLTLSQLPKYLALLYLIPKEPINSEYPTFSWIHSLLFSNTTSMF